MPGEQARQRPQSEQPNRCYRQSYAAYAGQWRTSAEHLPPDNSHVSFYLARRGPVSRSHGICGGSVDDIRSETSCLAARRAGVVQLALLVYELVKQVEEARFVVVADVLDVP
jgi:hypothetical protein